MSTTTFETTIKNYLDNRAREDSLFAETYKKANKNLKECCKYIYSQARKLAKGSNSVGIDDATVYGWAVHYYDEDDIKVSSASASVEVTAPVTGTSLRTHRCGLTTWNCFHTSTLIRITPATCVPPTSAPSMTGWRARKTARKPAARKPKG